MTPKELAEKIVEVEAMRQSLNDAVCLALAHEVIRLHAEAETRSPSFPVSLVDNSNQFSFDNLKISKGFTVRLFGDGCEWSDYFRTDVAEYSKDLRDATGCLLVRIAPCSVGVTVELPPKGPVFTASSCREAQKAIERVAEIICPG